MYLDGGCSWKQGAEGNRGMQRKGQYLEYTVEGGRV